MNPFFKCNYVNTYPDGNFSATTALYIGNLKRPAQVPLLAPNFGLPVKWKPDLSNQTAGTATLFEQSPNPVSGLNPIITTYDMPMSQADAQSLGTCLTMATLVPQKCTLAIYSGGVVATSRSKLWQQGPIVLNAKAPNSQSFAQNFVNVSTYLQLNPCPPPGKLQAPGGVENTLMWLTIMMIGAVSVEVGGAIFAPLIMAGALGAILNEESNAQQVSTAGVLTGGGFTDPVIIEDGSQWGDDQEADLPYDLGGLDIQYYDTFAF